MWGRIIKKGTFLTIVALIAMLCPGAFSEAHEIVVLKSAEIKPYNEALAGFKHSCDCRLRELLLSDIKNQDLQREVHDINPDMVLAIGMDAFTQAREIRDRPVVYTMVPDSRALSLSPENVSGVSMYISPGKYLDTMLELFPEVKRVGLVYDPKHTGVFVKEALKVAGARGIELVIKKADEARDVPLLIDSMKGGIDLFWMLPDTTVVNSETVNYMLLFSFQNRVPIFTFSKKYLVMGALASLSIDPFYLGVQAGEIANKSFYKENIRPPARVYARKTVLTINRKVAEKMGINIRNEIIESAEELNE
ncbi:MAG: ABC transporter substrate binding protein [Nitrospirota bacterium]|nr:ABC transporter substrate binding protein [Nitrospirota bacterium]